MRIHASWAVQEFQISEDSFYSRNMDVLEKSFTSEVFIHCQASSRWRWILVFNLAILSFWVYEIKEWNLNIFS